MLIRCGDCGEARDVFGECDCTRVKQEERTCAGCGEHIPPGSTHYIVVEDNYCSNCVKKVEFYEDAREE